MQSQTLMARARELGHADAEIARRIGVARSYLCDVEAGRKHMSPEAAALLADLVGLDAQEAMARQDIENAKEPRKSMLERALFTFAALGVCLALQIAPATADARAFADYTSCAIGALALLWWAAAGHRRRGLFRGTA